MGKLIAPTPDDIARAEALAQRQAVQPKLQVATPLNDIQLVTLAAAKILAGRNLNARDAVAQARALFVESIVQEHEGALAAEIERRLAALHPSEATPAGPQFVIPGTRP